ncbi:hypothetical protein Nepgr_021048 [Nepenthes gracilis]|uniref:Uncharacterized protein n=1 Tax=Nepenthes gracilis TaxID=150966 RepID=A0AAD3SY70_NEPGR|nr:hypothetical protein Nepgr_021048 [Nepenthes gracilis]
MGCLLTWTKWFFWALWLLRSQAPGPVGGRFSPPLSDRRVKDVDYNQFSSEQDGTWKQAKSRRRNGDLSRIDILLLKFAAVFLGLAFAHGGLSAQSCFESYQNPVCYSLGLFLEVVCFVLPYLLKLVFLDEFSCKVAICDGVAAGWMSCIECRFMIAPGSEMAILTEMLRHVAGFDQDACYLTCI